MDELLILPISISNWIIIEDALNSATDSKLFIKVFRDYIGQMPVFKVSEICSRAQLYLCEADFQIILDELWKCVGNFVQG